MNHAVLETSGLKLEFDINNGALVSVYSKISDWYILNRPQLGLTWRMMLPLEGKRNNNAWGHSQDKPVFKKLENGVMFTWDFVTSEFGGRHDITVSAVCEAMDDRAVFKMNIKNNSLVTVENVYYPYFGDMHRPEGCEKFELSFWNYQGLESKSLYPVFRNDIGTHSVDFPTFAGHVFINPPVSPFVLFSDEKGNSLCIGAAKRRIEAACIHAEAHPGWRNSNDFRLFSEDSFEGKDVFARFAIGHIPYIAPGMEFDLLPFFMEAYKGNWEKGIERYKKLSENWNVSAPFTPDWAKEPHSWLQIQINSPEDELRIKFKDLPKVGEDCKRHGITAIQLVGWNDGGQDRGNPSHDPDPRLGTFDELKEAVAKIKAMGIKVILFAKFTWADESRPDFGEVYKPLAIKDPYGNCYVYNGYQYMTLSQLSNINTRRLIPMCFHSEKYMEVCRNEFQKCLDLGADGILYDESQHHSPAMCCFDTSHGHRYGESTYKKDQALVEMFREMLDGREFLIAGEAIYDFQHNYYDIAYGRTWGREHKPTSRLMRPHAGIMTAVIGFNDRSMINQCLLNKYIISYEPYNFKGMPSDFPSTVAYGNKMDKLRTDLREYFWDGEFHGTQLGSVTSEDGAAYGDYAVYTGTNGKKGLIICNYGENNEIKVAPSAEGTHLGKYRLVDQDGMTDFNGYITIPPMSAAAVI